MIEDEGEERGAYDGAEEEPECHAAPRSTQEKPMAASSSTMGRWEPQPEKNHFPGVQQMEDPISENRLYSFSVNKTTIMSLCEAPGLMGLIKEPP